MKFSIAQLVDFSSPAKENVGNGYVFIDNKYYGIAALKKLGDIQLTWVKQSSLTTMHLTF